MGVQRRWEFVAGVKIMCYVVATLWNVVVAIVVVFDAFVVVAIVVIISIIVFVVVGTQIINTVALVLAEAPDVVGTFVENGT